MRIPLHADHPEPRKIGRAVEAIRRGEVIAYPTDTVYALGCSILEKKAIDRLYRIKNMKKDQPLSFLCPDLSDIARYAIVDNQTYRILKRACPGPYCFILKATRDVPKLLMMKRKTVGIRVPNHPVPQALLRQLGHPVISSSASWDGEVMNDPEDIDARFRELAMVLDADMGGLVPSTIIDLTGDAPEVVREGAAPADAII